VNEVRTEMVFRSAAPHAQAMVAGDFVFVSGQVARTADGNWVVGDFEAEVQCVLANLEAILAGAGCGARDICKINAFLSDRALYDRFNAVYQKHFAEMSYPARTTTICTFSQPEIRVEIDGIAYRPAQGDGLTTT
jgi:2-iminobutanoate/2-iminopropanoate deaminase